MIEMITDLRKLVLIWLGVTTVLLLLLLVVLSTLDDYRSCHRSEPLRNAQRHNVGLIKRAWREDARRAEDYSKIDPNPAGSKVNSDYAARRRALAASVQPAPPINCSSFPAGT